MSRKNYRTSTCDGSMDCWIFWTRFKLRSEKISKPRWQLQQVMKRIKMADRVDNETKEARLFLSQSNCKESEGNNTNVAFLRAHMAKMVTWSMQTKSLSRFESQSFRATRKIMSRGEQRFPVVWMCGCCCGSKVV